MPRCLPDSRVLVTGANGFLGRYLVSGLKETFQVVGFDIEAGEGQASFVRGSVSNPGDVEQALHGVDAIVIAHMAPNRPGVYDTPELPFDVNVKGTALLLQTAAALGIKRHVLISSVSVVDEARIAGDYLSRELTPSPNKLYGLTKTLQEATARYYHERNGLEIAVLRPAYISLGDTMEDKYGIRRPSVNWQAIDPRDIAAATRSALQLDDLGYEVFYLMAGPGAEEKADIAHTVTRLDWHPRYRFEQFPRDDEPARK